ncbi:hypothetical protein PG988_007912 [Apiospora saccharicola]
MSSSSGNAGAGGNDQPKTHAVPEDLPPELITVVFNNVDDDIDRAMLASTCHYIQDVGNIDIDALWNNPEYAWAFLRRVEQDANPPPGPLQRLSQPALAPGLPALVYPPERRHLQDPTFVDDIQPALYGLVKYRKQGMDTSWFLETDKEQRYRALGCHLSTYIHIWNKVDINQDGVMFYREQHVIDLDDVFTPVADDNTGKVEFDYLHPYLDCQCHRNMPRVLVKNDAAGNPVCSVYAADYLGPDNKRQEPPPEDCHLLLPEGDLPLQPSARGNVRGALYSCDYCNTDYRAEIRYRVDNCPQLVLTTWMHKGDASTLDAIQTALDDIVRPTCPTAKIPGPSGHIAEMSGMMLLQNEDLPSWLEDPNGIPETKASPEGQKCTLRIVWIPHDRTTGVNDVGHGVLEMVTDSFQQHLAQARFRSTFAGASSLIEPSDGSQSYYICNHPHMAITWSRCKRSGALNIVCIAQQRKINIFQDLVSCSFFQALAHIELAPSLLCSILICREVDGLLNKIKYQVRQTEVRTGHHDFMSRSEPPAPGDLIRLLAEISGCLSNLAVLNRRLAILDELKSFVVDELAKLQSDADEDREREAIIEFASSIQTIQQHSTMQRHDTEFFIRRAQIQRDALLHLVTEHDSVANQGIAKDAQRLADLAHKDSISIKALTLVATLFIPPTFVASLFSTPLFDWVTADESSAVDETTKGRKSALLYIAITGPLMLVTFFVWVVLTVCRKSRCNREVKRSRLMVGNPDVHHKPEVLSLVEKRTSGTSEFSYNGGSETFFGDVPDRAK